MKKFRMTYLVFVIVVVYLDILIALHVGEYRPSSWKIQVRKWSLEVQSTRRMWSIHVDGFGKVPRGIWIKR